MSQSLAIRGQCFVKADMLGSYKRRAQEGSYLGRWEKAGELKSKVTVVGTSRRAQGHVRLLKAKTIFPATQP